MRRIEVFLAILLVVIGILCLTMSGTLMLETGLTVFLTTFVQVCLWMGIPLILTGVIYWQYTKKRR
ncbi:hypothetical protein FQ085_14700 [Planococcus sp. ANT_H30]|uniref:hypothetical protein n=1 Tax=Planococcus sp. ANT_H30 TaxID=2597347 RepID=UPI0011EF1D55|nr:hypothetical protein [Planococcus sp. ANT_H30]KAA0956092.1 hypothetical protein FQ085_14700 [Planococcus sp. ANT_H30]